MSGRLRLARRSRIRSGSEIRAILRDGERWRGASFDVFSVASPQPFSRFGTIVPRHRHTIVERNRLRRRIREVGRTDILPALARAESALDVLVRAHPGAYGLTYQQIRAELTGALVEMQ